MSQNLLSLRDVTVTVNVSGREKKIVDSVDLDIPELSVVALVGGSGSGKTTTGFSILRLLAPPLTAKKGEVLFKGRNLFYCSKEQMRKVRGGEISMIFQEPINAFNPVFSIEYQIDEVMRYHTGLNSSQRRERVLELLDLVGITEPKRVAKNYPHQLSGGMRQRAMIAQAIAADPQLIIADEPTSSLDVTLQAKIIELFRKLKKELKLSILLITHDLGMVSHLADKVAVMTNGKIVESGETKEVLENPQHEYTRELMEALEV